MDRRDLRNALQDAGFTYRDARKIVSVIVASMAKALKKDKQLDLPFGTISLSGRVSRRRISFNKIARTYTKPKATFKGK